MGFREAIKEEEEKEKEQLERDWRSTLERRITFIVAKNYVTSC